MTKSEIQTTLRTHLPTLRRDYGVVRLGLFGSHVRGDQTADSDIDLLIKINNDDLSLLQFVHLRNCLSDLLEAEVDLVEEETLKPVLGQQILAEIEPV